MEPEDRVKAAAAAPKAADTEAGSGEESSTSLPNSLPSEVETHARGSSGRRHTKGGGSETTTSGLSGPGATSSSSALSESGASEENNSSGDDNDEQQLKQLQKQQQRLLSEVAKAVLWLLVLRALTTVLPIVLVSS